MENDRRNRAKYPNISYSQPKLDMFQLHLQQMFEVTSTPLVFTQQCISLRHWSTVAINGDCRRIRRQNVAEFGDYSRQCGQGFSSSAARLRALSPVTTGDYGRRIRRPATVAEFGDCNQKRRLSPKPATVAEFADCRRNSGSPVWTGLYIAW